ncbi:TetR family transcriptional regulator [Streptomyces sp. N2-109]|uniref:TetR family transcriptional regulator n=1 Tax=Streptomyces gossypii TaxID=2883101 RepID=A0ABT2JVX5_9ACTN|nr:TetR/AcrR family transcriptional regulator [Streptomyces gossypii]MCT2592064.1 TetR family transcriptional regulator [Streptomyces gossypii]
MPGRRDEVLDAAMEVLGSGGLRRLTYQAVDGAAGVPAGTTSNHFRTRDALVDGVVAHMVLLDQRDWEVFSGPGWQGAGGTEGEAGAQGAQAARGSQQGSEALAAALARVVLHLLGPGRARTTARYALLLEAVARPSLRDPLTRGRESLTRWGAEWLRELGSPTPQAHCRSLYDYLDGLLLHQIGMPTEGFDPEPDIRTVLTAFLPRD